MSGRSLFADSTDSDASDDNDYAEYQGGHENVTIDPVVKVNTGLMGNSQDFYWTIGAGYFLLPKNHLSLQFDFMLRTYDKTVFAERSHNWLYQYKETRMGFIIFIDKSFYLSESGFAIFTAVGAGFTSAKYKGSDALAESKGSLSAKGGIQYGRGFYFRIGYQYFRIPGVPSNWGIAEVGIHL
jgi:hypothetical protein